MNILVANEKHGTRIIDIDTKEKEENAVFGLIGGRLDEGWYFDEDEERARAIIESQNLRAGWAFLLSRRDAEYEWVEERTTEEF